METKNEKKICLNIKDIDKILREKKLINKDEEIRLMYGLLDRIEIAIQKKKGIIKKIIEILK
jgi:hypothetical protein